MAIKTPLSIRARLIWGGMGVLLAFLAAAGCDEIQGYWYSRPIDAQAFESFVRAQA